MSSKKTQNGQRNALLLGASVFAAAAMGSAPALAQDAADSEEDVIVVTGSRIARPGLTSVSPLTTVGEDEVTYSGAIGVEELLDNLPSVVATFGQGVGNGSIGFPTVSLRGLGTVRTLVLVDGQRIMPGDPRIPVADLNNIPSQLVERVDIITGGASAVYGSDAVAGVVNFVLRDDFEGIRLDVGHSFAWHENHNSHMQGLIAAKNTQIAAINGPLITYPDESTDAETFDATMVMGVNTADNRGNVTGYISYRRIDPLTQDQRDYGTCSLATTNIGGPVYNTHFCFGSGNNAYGRFQPGGGADLINNPDGTKTFLGAATVLFPGTTVANATAFNFAPYNYYQQDDTRYTAGMSGHYEVNPMFELYTRLMVQENTSTSNIAPSGLFLGGGRFAINCQNPLASAAQLAAICVGPNVVANPDAPGTIRRLLNAAYRFASSPRITQTDHQTFQAMVGSRGDLNDTWSYDFSMQYGKAVYEQLTRGDLSVTRINNALNVVLDGAGNPVCANAVARAAGCVPLDIFQALSAGLTPASVAYVTTNAFQVGSTTEKIANLSFTGDLGSIRSPWASNPIGLAVGLEYRSEALDFRVDQQFNSGDLAGSGGVTKPNSGTFDVFEAFMEARVPIVEDQPLFDTLAVEVGFRTADYSTAGRADAYKVLGEWGPTEDIRFRAGFNRAVRAPNAVELFTPQSVGLFAGQDPCAGANATTVAGCANTFVGGNANPFFGISPACPAGQCSTLAGGSDTLEVESADTKTLGFVFTPRFLSGFNATVDWYNIKVTNPIGTVGNNVILTQCRINNQFCNLIRRSTLDGSPSGIVINGPADGYVINANLNTGSIETTGLDVGVNWSVDVGSMGGLSFNFLGTKVQEFVIEPFTGGGSYDCAGIYGTTCGTPTPEWRHTLRTTWETPWDVSLSLNWRHIGEAGFDQNSTNPFLTGPGTTIDILPKFDYFDISGTWNINENLRFRAGINNVADKDPPVVDSNFQGISGPPFGNGNTYPGTYDSLGRVVFMGLTADF